MAHPTPNGLIRHRHSAFRQQIFDVTQAESEPEVEPYCLVNDLGRETIPAVADFLHPLGYSATGRTASPTRRDNALGIGRRGSCTNPAADAGAIRDATAKERFFLSKLRVPVGRASRLEPLLTVAETASIL